jgi:hypothetical protein
MMPSTLETTDIIGLGVYAPSEAARYARVATGKFSRWVFGAGEHEPVIQSELSGKDRVVTFLDFAQALSVHEIRLAADISLQKIRAAYKQAQQEHGVKYPFAVEHGIFVFGDLKRVERCELGIYIPHTGSHQERDKFVKEQKKVVQLTGKHKGNVLIGQIVQEFSRNLIFHKETGLADEYVAFTSHGHRILMDRNIRFGKPYLEHIGYEAETLAEAVSIERGVARAARIYDVDESAVLAALDFYKHLRTPPPKHKPKPVAA